MDLGALLLPERPSGFGVKQRQQVAGFHEMLQFLLFVRRQASLLVSLGQIAHPLLIRFIKTKGKDVPRQLTRQVAVIGSNDPREDCDFAGAAAFGGLDRHVRLPFGASVVGHYTARFDPTAKQIVNAPGGLEDLCPELGSGDFPDLFYPLFLTAFEDRETVPSAHPLRPSIGRPLALPAGSPGILSGAGLGCGT